MGGCVNDSVCVCVCACVRACVRACICVVSWKERCRIIALFKRQINDIIVYEM